ncbi:MULTISPECIES: hypothetical protein [unclassified Aeromonas]|uniref:hypothetical protein n=1 Tax=unclassified Aeromonas TaxID=257493 RepID=UPI0011B1E9DE|nr:MULTISPECIES: hypothetical protein [unclassified Aeromonas]
MSTREFPENRIFGLFAQKLRFAVYFQHNQSLAIAAPNRRRGYWLGSHQPDDARMMSRTCRQSMEAQMVIFAAKRGRAGVKIGDLAANRPNNGSECFSLILPIEKMARLE